MTRPVLRILIMSFGVALLFGSLYADNLFSQGKTRDLSKEVNMEKYMGLSNSGRLEKATFALG